MAQIAFPLFQIVEAFKQAVRTYKFYNMWLIIEGFVQSPQGSIPIYLVHGCSCLDCRSFRIFQSASQWKISPSERGGGRMQTRLFGILLTRGSSSSILATSLSLHKMQIHSSGITLGRLGSPKGFFVWTASLREDPHCGQSKGMEDHCYRLVLLEKKEWRVS